ncbi:MAG: flagellar protein FlgN [Limnochordia bacterium]|jgi:flagellar biosynthesis/type III secretory pathway chaperone|nr:flagellar protein FlgN [Bacillota bacterium]HOB08999.1 flagellar protein FlgN [Limnochordia bacterium]NLH31778.1 flagellar protein FlgN [Bacillota bacterium]HPT92995.1 flagellar protein FlgN [Limnochordia bacterium]HPZ31157.1 flagellar protein FlgN [Limnochordia bacterium]
MLVIDAFREVLKQETAIIEQLIQTGEAKRTVIADPDQLSKIIEQERTLLASLEEAERERSRLFDVLAPGKSVSEWLETVTDAELADQIHDLGAKFHRLRQINQLNQQLLQESLNLVQYSLNLLVAEPPLTYAKPKTKASNKQIIDRKV